MFKYENVFAPIFYCLYLFLGLISFTWSSDVNYSILQWMMTFESLIFVFIYMRVITLYNYYFSSRSIDLIKVVTFSLFPIMLIFIIGSFVEPDLFYRGMRGGNEQRLGGYYMNPNELGMLATMSATSAYLYLLKIDKKIVAMFMILAAVSVLVLTGSRSSVIGFLLIMMILIFKSNNKNLKILMSVGVIAMGAILLKVVIFKDGGGLDEVLSMTGRIPFWKALLNEGIVKEPFFGYGFMRINYVDYFQGLNTYAAKMTHNTFLQVLMNLGFVGFFIMFWQVIFTIVNYLKERKKSQYGNLFIVLFIAVFINSFTEFGIFGEANYGILFYQFLILLFVIRVRKNRSKKENLRLNLFHKRWGIATK